MTCKEFHSRSDEYIGAFSVNAELLEHFRQCADCQCVFDEQRGLRHHLQVVRDSVPQIPDSLDARVLSKYREHVATTVARSQQHRTRIALMILSWRGGVAALALVFITFALAVRRSGQPRIENVQTVSIAPKAESAPTHEETPISQVVTNKRRVKNARVQRAKPKVEMIPSGTIEASLPEGFRSLMYCDALSCPDEMEMIRVQLPPGFAGFAPASNSNAVVFADVLVGTDGIARGIRIVQ